MPKHLFIDSIRPRSSRFQTALRHATALLICLQALALLQLHARDLGPGHRDAPRARHAVFIDPSVIGGKWVLETTASGVLSSLESPFDTDSEAHLQELLEGASAVPEPLSTSVGSSLVLLAVTMLRRRAIRRKTDSESQLGKT